MTRDDVLQMAQEVGFVASNGECAFIGGTVLTPYLWEFALRVANLVAAAEREACAKVCDRVSCFHEVQEGADLAFDLATSIRARGKQ